MNTSVRPFMGRTGQAVANQYIINTAEGQYFQSYKSVVAFIAEDGTIKLTGKYDYSRTTMKYLCQFLNFSMQEIRAKIKAGEIEMVEAL